jgi:hypothetical protein
MGTMQATTEKTPTYYQLHREAILAKAKERYQANLEENRLKSRIKYAQRKLAKMQADKKAKVADLVLEALEPTEQQMLEQDTWEKRCAKWKAAYDAADAIGDHLAIADLNEDKPWCSQECADADDAKQCLWCNPLGPYPVIKTVTWEGLKALIESDPNA